MSRRRLGDGEMRALVVDLFERRPDFSDVDVAHNIGKRLGRKVSEQAVAYHRRLAGIPPKNRRTKCKTTESS